MARDMASSFNHLYGEHSGAARGRAIDDAVALLPGLDGRKMSKSYDNTIPLFAPRDQMRKLIMGILTDSRMPGEPKSTEGSAVFQLYQAFASAEETQSLAKAFAEGIAWGDAKQTVFERIDREIAPLREHYNAMMANPGQVESILLAGAAKARAISSPFMRELRHAVGLRNLGSPQAQTPAAKASQSSHCPVFKQYRESDGKFYFKLVAPGGAVLLQSPALIRRANRAS
jgi:tryptophanyl-tRNA synthetase